MAKNTRNTVGKDFDPKWLRMLHNTVIARFNDRTRFNWGFHDATRDQIDGRPRILLHGGKQNPQTVSKEYDAAYFHGYSKGLESAKQLGERLQTSESAWEEAKAEGLVS